MKKPLQKKGTRKKAQNPSIEKSAAAIWDALSSFEEVQRPVFTKEAVLYSHPRNGFNAFHFAVQNRRLDYIPEAFIFEEGLLAISHLFNSGENCFHIAARSRSFESIPTKFRTRENLLLRDGRGRNCLHLLAEARSIHLIPHELLIIENLLLPDLDGNTVIHYVAKAGGLSCLPVDDVPPQCWLLRNKNNETILHFAARKYEIGSIPICDFLVEHYAEVKKIVFDEIADAFGPEIERRKKGAMKWMAMLSGRRLNAG